MEQSDEALVEEHLRGNEAAFDELTRRHLPTVYSFTLRFVGSVAEAEDISQETFVKAWRSMHTYKRQTSKFKTWLMRIARNTAIDHLRKKRSIPFSEFSSKSGEGDEGAALFAETVPDEEPLPDALFATAENRQRVTEALETLAPEYREVLILHYVNGLTFQEIGEALQQPANTVKSRHFRALKTLRAALVGKINTAQS